MTKTKRNAIIAIQAAILPIAVIVLLLCMQRKESDTVPASVAADAAVAAQSGGGEGGEDADAPDGVWEPGDDDDSAQGDDEDGENDGDGDEVEIEVDAEEDEQDEAEKLVEDFDSTVDRWMNPTVGDVSMAEVDAFAAKFKALPKDRKEECLQRALNLVPDDHVMLLVGLLMDKSLEQEYMETIFNDLLNRDEDVKKTVMNEILKDKTHPCWPNVAWINDATGQKNEDSEENSGQE